MTHENSEVADRNGVSINFKALDGGTALTYAVSYKLKEMAEFLIENGTNSNSNCTNLKTPFCSDA